MQRKCSPSVGNGRDRHTTDLGHNQILERVNVLRPAYTLHEFWRVAIVLAGIGNKSAPRSLREACDIFLHAEELPHPAYQNRVQNATSGWKKTVREAVMVPAPGDGWILLSTLMENIKKINPLFDTHAFCHSGVLSLVQSCPDVFEIFECPGGDKLAGWHVRIRRDPLQ